ncbi:MAG: autotransporter domain-containing protein, partial [Myxococcota bacterium]|nr:autotransporter domain-containing protein [Myxococcota bacterium]
LFQLTQTLSGDYAGNITGEGSLEKGGIFDLTLSGENSFTGGIEVLTGDLIGSSQSLPGNIVLTQASSQVFFDQTEEIGDGVHAGRISGEGKIIKLGPRTLTLAGANSHRGDTEVRDGILRGHTQSLVGNIFVSSTTSAVEFVIPFAQTFSGVVSGPGDFVKSGTDSLTLTGSNSHSGATRIDEGALRVAAALSGTSGVTVAAGASLVNAAPSLGQLGTTVAGNLVSLGGVELGGTSGFLRVFQGDASLEPGSSLAVTVNDLGQSSFLQVDQAAVVNGVEFVITAKPGLYTHPDPYVLMTAASFTAGAQGLGFTSPVFAFLDIGDPTISPGGGELTVTISPNSAELSDYAETPNQVATAPALGEALASGSPDANELLRNLSVASTSQVPEILDQVSGESLGAFSNPRLANAYALFQAVSRRFTANDYAGGQRPAEAAGPPAARLGAWLEGVGIFSHQSGEINASDIDANNGGLIAGFDTTLPGEPDFRLGGALAYTRLSIDGSRGLAASGNTYQAALYASWEHRGAYVGIAGRYGYSDMETDRRIVFEDIDRRAQGESSGQEAGALIEIGARLGDPTRLAYRPFLRVQYNHLSQDALQETGAGDLSLATAAQDFDIGRSPLGVRISSLFTLGGEFGIEPEIRAGWSHDFGDLARPVVARFYTTPGALPFTTLGAETDPDSLFVGMGYLMRIGDVPLVGLDYDLYASDGYKVHVVSAQLYMRW